MINHTIITSGARDQVIKHKALSFNKVDNKLASQYFSFHQFNKDPLSPSVYKVENYSKVEGYDYGNGIGCKILMVYGPT